MKILHTIPGMGVNSGGPTTCTYNLMKGLQSRAGIQVNLLTYDVADNRSDRLIGQDQFMHAIPAPRELRIAYSRRFRNGLNHFPETDLVHVNGLWQYPTFSAVRWAQKHKKPYVIAPHGMLYPQALQVKPFLKKMMMLLFQQKDLERASCLQATCKAEMKHIRDLGFKNPIAIVPNALDVEEWLKNRESKPKSTTRRVGFVGRLHPIKNIDRLIEAWSALELDFRDTELWIIGNGDTAYRTELEMLVSRLGLQRVIFAGFQQGQALQELIQTLSFLVLPSKSENFGMVVPEALIYGVPVIASKGTPWEDLVQYKCGWWVDNSVEVLSETLKLALSISQEEHRRMGENGKQMVLSQYSTKTIANKMHELYAWLLNQGEQPEFVFL